MQLPLARLELTRTARRRSTHGLRFVAPVLCLMVLVLVWFFKSIERAAIYDIASAAGNGISMTVLLYLMLAGTVIAPLFASGVVATEKQERSLGLLLLTNIQGADLIFAKGVIVFLQIELLMLGCLPLQAIASLFGGLSLKMLVGQQIAAASLCLVATMLGLLCSTLTWRAIDAFLLTIGAVAGWLLFAYTLDIFYLNGVGLGGVSGFGTLLATVRPGFEFATVWRNGLYSLALCAVIASVIGLRLPRLTDELSAAGGTARQRRRFGGWLDHIHYFHLYPIDRLYAANAAGVGGALYRWPWWPVVVLVTIVAVPFSGGAGSLVIAMLVVYDAASCITAVRQNGGADLLYLTEARSHQLARGIHRTHFRRALLFLPAMIVADAWGHMAFGGIAIVRGATVQELAVFLASFAVSIIGTWVNLYAYSSLGCVASTWSSNPAMLTFKALLALVGVYILSGIFGGFLMMGFMFTPSGQSAVTMQSNTIFWGSVAQMALMAPFILVLLAFGRAWQSRFGQKLARRWRTGAEL